MNKLITIRDLVEETRQFRVFISDRHISNLDGVTVAEALGAYELAYRIFLMLDNTADGVVNFDWN